MSNQQEQASTSSQPPPPTAAPRKVAVTEEEVKKMLRIKDFYEILGVTKTSTDDEIKKQYKKLALRFHPDKLRLPGAQEVFKKIAQAYDCLTNPDKRAYYDRTGSDEPQQHQQAYEQHFYQQDGFDPNDIFNMFFGQGFYPQQQRHQRQYYYQQQQRQEGGQQQQRGGFTGLLQLLPFLLIMFSGLFGQLFQESPEFSLSKSQSFGIHHKSLILGADYYVDNSFFDKVMEDVDYLGNFEWKVENEYVNNLKGGCMNQQNIKRQYTNQSKMSWMKRDQQYYKNLSDNVDLSPCIELDNLSNEYDLSRYF